MHSMIMPASKSIRIPAILAGVIACLLSSSVPCLATEVFATPPVCSYKSSANSCKLLTQQTRQLIRKHDIAAARASAETAVHESARTAPNGIEHAECLRDLAEVYEIGGDSRKAEQLYELCLSMQEQVYGPASVRLEPVILRLVALTGALKESGKQEKLLKQLIRIRKAVFADNEREVVEPERALKALLLAQSRFAEATGMFTSSAQAMQRDLHSKKQLFVTAIEFLNAGATALNANSYSQAEQCFNQALSDLKIEDKSSEIGSCYFFLARCALARNDFKQAASCMHQALDYHQKLGNAVLVNHQSVLFLAGDAFTKAGEYEAAERVLDDLLKYYQAKEGPNGPTLKSVFKRLKVLYQSTSNKAKVAECDRRLANLRH